MPKPLRSVLVKPAGPSCNLRCGYCFYLRAAGLFPAGSPLRMTPDIHENLIRQVMRQGPDQVSFCWQGGEPTLMGLDFYRQTVAWQRQYGRNGQQVGNALQTNGLLLDRDWAAFLAEYRFLVGLSLDGPPDLHNAHRRNAAGAGSWDQARRSAEILMRRGVAVNVLCLVTASHVGRARQVWDALRGCGFDYLQFIPCVEADPGGNPAPYSVSGEGFGEFLCELFDLWRMEFQDGRPLVSVRWFDSVAQVLAGLPSPECTLAPECGDYLVVEHNGDVFSCDFFVDGAHRLGSLRDARLIDLLNSPAQLAFGRAKQNDLPRACQACRWLALCRGGCPKDRNRLADPGLPNPLCRGYQRFFEYAEPMLAPLARRAAAATATRCGTRSAGLRGARTGSAHCG